MNRDMVPQKPHVALTLLELANWLRQGRLILPGARFQEIDSRSSDTISLYRAQVLAMFGNLPSVDAAEAQSFFVARVRQLATRVRCGTAGIEHVVEIRDLEALFPVNEEGAQVFRATERIPGVVLKDSIFDESWNDFFIDRHALITVNMAYDFAGRFFPVKRPFEGADRWARLMSVVKSNDSEEVRDHLDGLGKVFFRVIRYRRPTDRPDRYNDESAASVFADFFKCVLDDEESDFKNDCRKFHIDVRAKPDATIGMLVGGEEFRGILNTLNDRFGSGSAPDLIGVLFFLLIRLHKQNAQIRKLSQLPGFIQENSGFSQASVETALLLVALSEEPDAISEFVHTGLKTTYGVFSTQPVPVEKVPHLIPHEFWLAPPMPETVADELAEPKLEGEGSAGASSDDLPTSEPLETLPGGGRSGEIEKVFEQAIGNDAEASAAQSNEKTAPTGDGLKSQAEPTKVELDEPVSAKPAAKKKPRSRKKRQKASKGDNPKQIGIDSIPAAESPDE